MKTDEYVWICYKNKKFACTGFDRLLEKALSEDISKRGGTFQKFVSNRTNYLIVNTDKTFETATEKYKKAMDLRKSAISTLSGKQIHIISYSDYLKYRGINYLNGREDEYEWAMPDLIKVYDSFSDEFTVKAVTWHENGEALDDYEVEVVISNEENVIGFCICPGARSDNRVYMSLGDYNYEHCKEECENEDHYLTIKEAIEYATSFINNQICSVACLEEDAPLYSDPVKLMNATLVLEPTRDKLTKLLFGDNPPLVPNKQKFRISFWKKEKDFIL